MALTRTALTGHSRRTAVCVVRWTDARTRLRTESAAPRARSSPPTTTTPRHRTHAYDHLISRILIETTPSVSRSLLRTTYTGCKKIFSPTI